MSSKPDNGYSVTCPEVEAETKRPFWVLLSALGQLQGTTSGQGFFFRLYFYSKTFMFVCLSYWKWMYRNCIKMHIKLLQNRKERCVLFTQAKGEAGFPLFPWIPGALPFIKKLTVLAYVNHSMHGHLTWNNHRFPTNTLPRGKHPNCPSHLFASCLIIAWGPDT